MIQGDSLPLFFSLIKKKVKVFGIFFFSKKKKKKKKLFFLIRNELYYLLLIIKNKNSSWKFMKIHENKIYENIS